LCYKHRHAGISITNTASESDPTATLIRVSKLLGSTLGWDTDHPKDFSGFPQTLQAQFAMYLKLGHDCFHPQDFLYNIHHI
jgi:hypothetical protein